MEICRIKCRLQRILCQSTGETMRRVFHRSSEYEAIEQFETSRISYEPAVQKLSEMKSSPTKEFGF
jgi:hypothetical protein